MEHAAPSNTVSKLFNHIIFKTHEVCLQTNFFLPKLAFLQLLQAVSVIGNISVNIAQ